jgi:peptidoglycan/xylan/chitin deacetylase (PgdA/CDA1 family)
MSFQRVMHWPQRVYKKFRSQTLILLYHRVADLETDPQLLSISPEHFAEHLEYISENYNPISLSALGRAIEEKKIPDKSVVITFDDGYADNFLNAKPLLEKYDVPATVFVTSGYVGSNREFWWDELERLLLLPKDLPDKLELDINGTIYRWDLTNKICKSQKRNKVDSSKWNVTMNANPGPEYKVYRDLHKFMKPLLHEEQQKVLDELARWANLSRDGRPTHMVLECNQLKELEHGGLIEVGAHTVNHPMLSVQSLETQTKEIIENKKYLEDILGHRVNTFSYPFGGKMDFNSHIMKIVRKNGFGLACANYSGSVINCKDPYRLPRNLVRNWNINLFSLKIEEWFDE